MIKTDKAWPCNPCFPVRTLNEADIICGGVQRVRALVGFVLCVAFLPAGVLAVDEVSAAPDGPSLQMPVLREGRFPGDMGDDAAPDVAMTAEELDDVLTPTDVDARMAELKDADVAALQAALTAAEARMSMLQDAMPRLRSDLRAARTQMMTSSDEAKETRRQIAELEDQLRDAIEALPVVQEKASRVRQLEQSSLAESRLRREINMLIFSKQDQTVPSAGEAVESPLK